jgi:hypothetical protein
MAETIHKPKGTFAKLMFSQSPTPPPQDEKKGEPLKEEARHSVVQSTSQSINQSSDQSINRSIDQSTIQSAGRASRPVSSFVDRPKGFYITKRLDQSIDEAVRYFQKVHGIKADRSIVVNAILDSEENWTDEKLDRLVDRLINQLTNRLTGQ